MAEFIKYLYKKNMFVAKSFSIFSPEEKKMIRESVKPEDLEIETDSWVKSDSTTQVNKAILMKLIGDGARIFQGVVDPYKAAEMFFDLAGFSSSNSIMVPKPQPQNFTVLNN